MHTFEHLRRRAALAAGILATGALAAFGSAPALAQTHIYGGGAALQNQLQNDILIPDSLLSSDITFTASTSGNGFNEFGNNSGTLGLGKGYDTVADTAGQLDAYVAVDSGPTGPLATSGTNLYEANKASGTDEITVPVAQTPLDILLSLPEGIKLNCSQEVDLTNALLSALYAGTVPQQNSPDAGEPYLEDSWGALLVGAGLTAETSNSSPSVGEFYDAGAPGSPFGTGGWSQITVELRKNGAGTSLNLKQYLAVVSSGTWSSYVNAESYPVGTYWPSTLTSYLPSTSGNSTDLEEAEAVFSKAATVGYATAGDAATAGFTHVPTWTDHHQALYAEVQDDGTGAASHFADPENGDGSGLANVYTGSNIKVNNIGSGVGDWIVPGPSWTESWSGTLASDPDVFDDAGGKTGDEYYPIVAVAYDLAWSDYSTDNLADDYSNPDEVGYTAQQFLEFATSEEGQEDIQDGDYYYAQLPTEGSGLANIQQDAQEAAEAVD